VLWVEYPALTLLPPALLALVWWSERRRERPARGVLVAAAAWLVYALYEIVMYFWSRQVIAPIRVDLLLLTPLMYLVTGFGLVSWYRARRSAGTADAGGRPGGQGTP
jgi:hypothetical protein